MRRILVLVVVLLSILIFSGTFSLSVLNLTTIGVEDGTLDYFPIVYLTYSPFDFLSLKVTDYLALNHYSWSIGEYSIFKPRYYYLESKFNFSNINLTVDILKARMKKTQTEKLDGLRVGGLNFDYYGLGVNAKYNNFDLGIAYDVDHNAFAGFVQTELFGFKLGEYYETRYSQFSVDLNKSFNIKGINVDTWGAVSAKSDNLIGFSDLLEAVLNRSLDVIVNKLSNFSYLLGVRANYSKFELASQFLKIGANKYDADFQTGDPNDEASLSGAWAFYADLNYMLGAYELGVFLRQNSVWVNSNYLPLIGAKLSYKDFTLKVGNGDLISNISGEQKIAVELNYFYSLDFDKLFVKKSPSFKTEKKGVESETTYNSIMDVIFGEEGQTYTVKGVVTSPKDLLGTGSFYIQDEVSGLMIYAPGLTEEINIGDVVVVTGKSKLWNDIIEIVADQVEKVGTATPKADVLTSLSKTFISSLVYVEGVVKEKHTYDFIIDTGSFTIKVYIKKGTNIDLSSIQVGTKVKVIGILTTYQGEYEILPRWQEDIEILE